MESETRALEYKELSEGLDFILEHFPQHEPLFPRTVMTKLLVDLRKGQQTVYYKDDIISHYEGALRKDCRIGAYPKYEILKEKGLFPPTYRPKPVQLFIDLDLETLGNSNMDKTALDAVLNNTLKNIELHVDGAVPTVLWTGGGYHIYLPLDPDYIPVYEELPEFTRFKDDDPPPSVKFLRYAAKKLTGGKSDKHHNPSFESCLWRIPGSLNSKYQGEGAKVKLIQRWNGMRARPSDRFMYTDFLVHLAQERIDEIREERRRLKHLSKYSTNSYSSNNNRQIYWIEKLLQTGVEDNRKGLLFWVLSPYLITVRRLDCNTACSILESWLDKCHQVKKLKPCRSEFNDRINEDLKASQKDHRWPTSFEKFKEYYPDVYKTLKLT